MKQLPLLLAPLPPRKRVRTKKASGKVPHTRRPVLSRHHPVHVVLRVVHAIGPLRRRLTYLAIRDASIRALQREDFRIVHLSVQRTHIHLLVEADDRKALSRGMQGFEISAAKRINHMLGKELGTPRRGKVFADRYYADIIRSPRHARHALAYVLNNWHKHGDDRERWLRSWSYDPFSSGWSFAGWAELDGSAFLRWPPTGYAALLVKQPSTWLLRTGWKRHGLISYREVPSARSAT